MVLLDCREPMFHYDMMGYLDILSIRYRFLRVIYIGKSSQGKSIPAVKIGTGDKNIIYTAGINGNETLTSIAAVRFINELCEFIRTGRRVYNISAEYIFRTRSIYVVPMVNPDGIELSRFDRIDKSDPDTGNIEVFANTLSNVKLLAALRLQLKGNYVACADINGEGMRSLAKLYARMTGNVVADFPCVFRRNYRYAFDISCDDTELFAFYMRLREFLFTAPVLC